ncbi:MAG TPA: hypothetical protein VGM31_04685 [Puia sp.]|jgi:hypothetical protein
MPFKTSLFYTLLILPSFLYAQLSAGDSSSRLDRWPVDSLVQNQLGGNLRLFTGAEYIRNGQHAQGHPFFQSDIPLDGSASYDGANYENILLQYDLITGEVITHDSTVNANISLVREKLPRFTISGHVFLWLPAVGDSAITLDPGYYEMLYNGPCSLVARHEKKMVYPTTNEEIVKYVESTNYFLRRDGQYFRIEGQHSLLKVLADKKDPLKKFIRQNKLQFDKYPGNALIQVIHYYTQLKN